MKCVDRGTNEARRRVGRRRRGVDGGDDDDDGEGRVLQTKCCSPQTSVICGVRVRNKIAITVEVNAENAAKKSGQKNGKRKRMDPSLCSLVTWWEHKTFFFVPLIIITSHGADTHKGGPPNRRESSVRLSLRNLQLQTSPK